MRKVLVACMLFSVLISCDGDKPNTNDDFDRTQLLLNLSDNIILPALSDFKTSTASLNASITTFNTTPDLLNLTALQNAFESAYIKWQSVSLFEFGPADNTAYRANVNTYPTDVTNITSLINTGNYNLDAISNYDSKGFPALDYLLFGSGNSNQAVLDFFTTKANAIKNKQFLVDVSTDLVNKTNAIYNEWTNGYDATFKSNKENNLGSSIGVFLNAYIQHFENRFRTLKIGLPAGVFSIEGNSFPAESEAFYAGISTTLIKANFDQLKNVYLGGTGEGIDDHLIGVNASTLNTDIKAQFELIDTKLNDLTNPFSSQVENDRASVLAVYNEIQRIITLFKADLVSALSIQITFSDTDGD